MRYPRRPAIKHAAGMGAALVAALLLTMSSSLAQSFPERDARIVVTTSPGGAADRIARLISSGLQSKWHKTVTVENRTGASGVIGAELVMKGPADGHTMLFASGTFIQTPAVLPDTPYEPLREFMAVSQICTVGIVFVVAADSPYDTLEKYLAAGRGEGLQPLSYATIGVGSSGHLYGEILSRDTNTRMLNVPFPGEAPGLTAVAGGHVTSTFASISSSLPLIKAGKLRALAVVGNERSALLPQTPTFAELGVPRLNLTVWYGILVRAGTPLPIVERISADVAAVVKTPEFSDSVTQLGFDPKGTTPAEFTDQVARDYTSLKGLIKETGVKPPG
jgi:tripartite-type tricarboxylate transporter receptor subunit TctC